MNISVVICCFNSAARIEAVLDHLIAQQTPVGVGWEVVLVDNNCSDATVEVANTRWSRADVNFRVVRESRPGLAYAREAGANTATGEIIIFCDDDNWLSEGYLEIVFQLFRRDASVAAVGGWGYFCSNSSMPDWFEKFSGCYACQRQSVSESYVKQLAGAGLSIRRVVLDDLKCAGFSSFLTDRKLSLLSSGGDGELCKACRLLGWRLLFSPALRFGHFMPPSRLTEGYLLRLANGLGQSCAVLAAYERALGDCQKWKAIVPIEMIAAGAIVRGVFAKICLSDTVSLDGKVRRQFLCGIGKGYARALIYGQFPFIRKQIARIRAVSKQKSFGQQYSLS